MSRFLRGVLLVIAVGCPAALLAEDAYFSVPLAELQLTEGRLPTGAARSRLAGLPSADAKIPYAVLDGPGEAYVVDRRYWSEPWSPTEIAARTATPLASTFAPRRQRM